MGTSTPFSTKSRSKLIGILFLLSLLIPLFNWMFLLSTFNLPDGNCAFEIQNHELRFRLAILIEIGASVIILALAYYLQVLLKTVNANLSLLAFTLRATEAILSTAIAMGHYFGLCILNADVETSRIFWDVAISKYIFLTSFPGLFMGMGMMLYAYLFLKSGYISQKLALFGIVSYLLVVFYDSTVILFPQYSSLFLLQILGGLPVCLFQISIGVLFLIKGINFTQKNQTTL